MERQAHTPDPRNPSTVDPAAVEDLLHIHFATLYRPGAGVALMQAFGSAAKILSHPASAWRRISGVSNAVTEKLLSQHTRRQARTEARTLRSEGLFVQVWGTPGYPPELLELENPPLVLFSTAALGERRGVPRLAVVGTRRPSPYGERSCRRFVRAVGRHGVEIVSGLARGIDGHAHAAAVEAGAPTTAVLGSGLGRIYPPEHRELARRVRDAPSSQLLTELPFSATPRSFHFPMRNRILSGLARALFVVEAGERSGTLITVGHALEQGKTVFVLPGRVDQEEARGCLRLLAEGAVPAIEPGDLLSEFQDCPAAPPGDEARADREVPVPADRELAALFARDDSWHPDTLASTLGRPLPEVLQRLNQLELAGQLRRLPGGSYGRRD